VSEPTKAVFLSYASQDADAAKRIAEALRAAGVEVWFDQAELVGGDAWDQKIRTQVRECALFVPVISATTQGRREAYFRLEWKIADERTHLMAKGTPFILPVVIDDTSDRGALVPDSFLAVQWTKLPRGETSSAFAEPISDWLRKRNRDRRRFLTPTSRKQRSESANRRLIRYLIETDWLGRFAVDSLRFKNAETRSARLPTNGSRINSLWSQSM
jgi:hypothetical protein